MTPIEKQKKLDELAKRSADELQFELSKHSKLVFGEGNPDAEIFFLGEAPGAQEDKLQRPFIGVSGQLLRRNIRSLGWKESDVYITSVLKHRPPANRDPTPDEIELNRPLLDEQIAVIDPLIVVTLGRFSMGKFLPNVKVSQVHGKIYKVKHGSTKRFVVPLYHPAAALRSTQMKEAFEKDFLRLPKILDWAKQKKADLQLETAVEEFVL
jgi:uracil-DNA glycosylase family 4